METINSEILEIIIEEELFSFNNYLSRLGITFPQFINEVKSRIKEILQDRSLYLKKLYNTDEIQSTFFSDTIYDIKEKKYYIEDIQSINEYLNYNRMQMNYIKECCVDVITNMYLNKYPLLGIDEYVKNSKHSSIIDFALWLNNIHIINIYDDNIDFNSMLETSKNKEYYFLRNNKLFDQITLHLCPLIVNSFYSFGDETGFHKKFDPIEIFNHIIIYFEKLKTSKLNKGIDHSNSVNYTYQYTAFNKNSEISNLFGRDLFYGLQYYSLFHEYGHIVLGHFNCKLKQLFQEIEADCFAINAISIFLNRLDVEYKSDFMITMYCNYLTSPLLLTIFKLQFDSANHESICIRWLVLKQIIEYHLIINKIEEIGLKIVSNIEDLFRESAKHNNIDLENIVRKFNNLKFEDGEPYKFPLFIINKQFMFVNIDKLALNV